MNMIRIFSILLFLILASCSGVQSIDIISKPLELQTAQPADPGMVHMEPVTFRVVTKDNLDAFVQEMIKTQGNPNFVIVAITTDDYKNLALNLDDLKRYIQQQKSIIIYYKKVTNTPSVVVDKTPPK